MSLYKLTAVNEHGYGADHSWGDSYEVHASSYGEARDYVLGLEDATGPAYVQVVRAWRKDGWFWTVLDPGSDTEPAVKS